MLDRIRNLAELMRAKKAAGEKFVVMLGAGASLSSGIKPTKAIMEELLASYGKDLKSGSVEARFDELWRRSTDHDRATFLEPYLERRPSSGYEKLAKLIQSGFFDLIISFNYDRLLELALRDVGFTDCKVIVRGETKLDAIRTLVEAEKPQVKLLKLHGSLRSADYFLFSRDEIVNYPPELHNLVRDITKHDIIICGYALTDICVIRSFYELPDGGSVYYVNPSGAGDSIRGFLPARRSLDKVIEGDDAKFDNFFEALYKELLAPPPPLGRPRINPFKFLDSYREADRSWFLGRKGLTRSVLKKIETHSLKALHLCGKAEVGKTSLVRAGLIACLDASRYECVYMRCRSEDIEKQLRSRLENRFSVSLQGRDWNAALCQLKGLTPKHILIFLDQFEKVVQFHFRDAAGSQRLKTVMELLIDNAPDRMTLVFITLESAVYLKLLIGLKVDYKDRDLVSIDPLKPERVSSIIRHTARQGGIDFAPGFIQDLCKRYEESGDGDYGNKRAFTLTHIQTLCYYAARGLIQRMEDLERCPNQSLLSVLDSVVEERNLMNLIDELPQEERTLMRSLLKIVCNPTNTTKQIVELIKDRFPDFVGEDKFPEPID